MIQEKIYNRKGEEAGKVELPEGVFGLPWNADLVHQVVTSMQSSARTPVAHTKTRGEVRGGGKKPWQQKGTGRARHGSTRSPIWVGGGVTHGPRNDKNFLRKVNKKMKTKALHTILSRKLRDNELIFIDAVSFPEPKTKDAQGVLRGLSSIKGFEKLTLKKVNAAFIALPKKDILTEKSFRNIGNVEVGEARNLNPLQLLSYKYLIVADPKESLKTINKA